MNKNKQIDVGAMANEGKQKVTDFAKSKVFDLIGIGLIVAMLALILGVLEIKELTKQRILSILIEFVPFYLAALALTLNYYTKGSFAGKGTSSFKKTVEDYSNRVNGLTGQKIELLDDFCVYYNNKALQQMQDNELKKVAITHDRFNIVTHDKNGNELAPLKTLTRKELKQLYNKRIVKIIIKCQKMTVKGIHSNILLGNSTLKDTTDLGHTEKELKTINTAKYALAYVFSIGFMVLIGLKNILEWGWMGLLLVAFKVIYVVCRSIMRYFDGYNTIVNQVKNHISRKTDIIKEYEDWYEQHKDEYNIKLLPAGNEW